MQRFGSKRAMLLAHATYAVVTGDAGLPVSQLRTSSPLGTLRAAAAMYASLADSPRAAVRNLAYLLNDLSDPALRRHVLRMSRTARVRYEQMLTDAIAAGELRDATEVRPLARPLVHSGMTESRKWIKNGKIQDHGCPRWKIAQTSAALWTLKTERLSRTDRKIW